MCQSIPVKTTVFEMYATYAAVNEVPDTPYRGAMWGICFLGVPKTQKSPQPGTHFMSKPPDNPQVKPPPNRVGLISWFVFGNDFYQ